MRYSDLEYYVDFIHVFIIPDNFEHIQEFYCRIRLRNDAPNEDTLHLFYDCPSTESIRDEFFRWAYCEEGNYTISRADLFLVQVSDNNNNVNSTTIVKTVLAKLFLKYI
jgi:hypothetical protein